MTAKSNTSSAMPDLNGEEEWECLVQNEEQPNVPAEPVVPSSEETEPEAPTPRRNINGRPINGGVTRRPTMSEEAYAESGGGHCPFCNSDELEGNGQYAFEGEYAYAPIICANCEATYDDVYTLSGYSSRG